MITIPKAAAYLSNVRRVGALTPCIVCGRAIKDPAKAAWLMTAYGADAVTEAERVTLPAGADSGAFPIGADCLRSHPDLRPYVQKPPAGSARP